MRNFLDLFDLIQKGDFGLTEEAVYMSIQSGGEFLPLWGGNEEHVIADRFVSVKGQTKKNEPITVFEGAGIIISLDGSSGSMTYKPNGRFALNHHAGFIKVRSGKEKEILPEFFALFFQNDLRGMAVSEGSKTLTIDSIYQMEFEIPPFEFQKNIMDAISPILREKQVIERILREIEEVRRRILSDEYGEYQGKDVSVSELLDCISGNSGLTEQYMYSLLLNDEERKYKVLTGSQDIENAQRFFQSPHPKNPTEKIHVHFGEGVHVIRKGKAGKFTYLPPDHYTLNDDAYLLISKKDAKYEMSLKWFAYTYQHLSMEYSSSADNGTWNKTGFFDIARIDVPLLKEQERISKGYEMLVQYEKALIRSKARMDDILNRKPVI